MTGLILEQLYKIKRHPSKNDRLKVRGHQN